MENNNGKNIFYGVIGVSTLIVAIIGATFAYFSATAENAETVKGAAAAAKLSLTVEKLSQNADYDTEPEGGKGILVPLQDDKINAAVIGAPQGPESLPGEPVMCLDANGNASCQVYKITIKNDGTASATLTGSLTLAAAAQSTESEAPAMKNLKWSAIKNNELPSPYTFEGANAMGTTTLESGLTLNAGAQQDYYVAIWISETGSAQEGEDHGAFIGTVKFDSTDGGLTSTFNDFA